MKKTIILALVIALIAISSCKKEEEPYIIEGTITFEFLVSAGDLYIYLDIDGDPSNGYRMRGLGELTGNEGGVSYSFDTEDIPDEDYYLYAGFDAESDTNMDPLDISKWEALGWYGNNTDSTQPASPPVNKIRGTFDFKIFGLR